MAAFADSSFPRRVDPCVEPERFLGLTLRRGIRLEATLGVGGMGAVFLGVDRSGRRWAVKLARPHGPGARGRYRLEAQLTARLTPGRVVPILWTEETGPAGLPYQVMPFISGANLGQLLASRPLEATSALWIAEEVALALEELHAEGAIHLDVTPSNIMVDDLGRVWLIDLSSAQIFGQRVSLRAVYGTPAYMSPEHLEGRAVDARADIYALGALLRRMLSGNRPTPGVQGLLRRMTSPNPRNRPRSAAAVARRLVELRGGEPAQFPGSIGRFALEHPAQPPTRQCVTRPVHVVL